MTAFKKLTAYSDVKCKWVSSTYPYDEENTQLKAENAKLREQGARLFDKTLELGTENAGLQERIENQRRKLEHAQTPEYVAALEAENAELKREAADTIESLAQKVEDLEGMLGELPPEGKCAMLLVKQVGGEYIWGCEKYDFASYCLVDSEADTYTGMTLNDQFGRADWGDKLAMAKELRKMAASLESQGDVLGVMDAAHESCKQVPEQGERENGDERESYDAGFKNGVKACLQQFDGLIHEGADVDEIQGWIDRQWEEEI